jgi:DNA-3-methyladenine glycosylase I
MDGKPPPRRRPKTLAAYLEALSRPVFQAGMSWRVIDAKWDGIRRSFAGFDPRTVADFGPGDIERLLGDPRVVRSKAKIEATIDNAQALLELDAEYGGFARYLVSHGGFDETVADLQRQFRFIGDSGAYHFLYAIGQPVPPHDEWFAASRRPPRRRRDAREARRRAATGGA